jgi:hypothetical protein
LAPALDEPAATKENNGVVHCKKELAIFPSPAGMSLIKLSLDGKNKIIPAQEEFDQ